MRGAKKRRLILASASRGRKWVLEQLGLDFDVMLSCVDEEGFNITDPVELVSRLSLEKARDVAARVGTGSGDGPEDGALVIGSDTVVVQDGEIIGKPRDLEDARRMLMRLAGRAHEVVSGVALVEAGSGRCQVDHDITTVRVRDISHDIIERYIRTGEPLGKAGAYAIQGRGALIIDGIDGCYFNVVGLPIRKLSDMLMNFGVELFQPM
ncbi:MAG: septum formation protein Maf [Firmicutes bacterium]|nr:septum formation protein Maf [Bacillota bacterium]